MGKHQKTPALDILDCGCGTGMVAVQLRRRGVMGFVTGFDLSQTSLDTAGTKGLYTKLLRCSLEERLPFPDETFGALLCVGVLSYVKNFDVCIGEFLRVCKPGATIVFTHRSDLVGPNQPFNVTNARLMSMGAWTK